MLDGSDRLFDRAIACGLSSLANPGLTNRDATSFAATSPLSKRETGHCSIEKSSLRFELGQVLRENLGEIRDVLLLDTIGRVERRASVGMNGIDRAIRRAKAEKACDVRQKRSRIPAQFSAVEQKNIGRRKEIEGVPQLRGVEPAFDIREVPVAKTLGVTDPRPAFADSRGEGERLPPFAPLMAPARVGAFDRIAQEQDELDIGIIGADALERLGPIDIDGRRLSANPALPPPGKAVVILPRSAAKTNRPLRCRRSAPPCFSTG